MNSGWRTLEKDFRDIPNTFGDLRADWSTQPQIPNHWRLAGGASREVRDRFEAVARLAGQLLASSPLAAAQVSDEVVAQSDPLVRWLMAVRHLTGRFEFGPYGTLQDASGIFVGHMLTGSIPNVIDASALACLHLATTDAAIQPHARSTTRLFIDQIDSFSEVRRVEPRDVLPLLTRGRIEASEDEIQACFERILGVPLAKKDWGGEENDLYTANIVVDGQRQATAFMLKGRGVTTSVLELAACGKNGDQIIRLFQSPAALFVIQFVGMISENVIKDAESKTRDLVGQGRPVRFCVIDGQDTARLLRAYGAISRP